MTSKMGQVGARAQTLPNTVMPPGGHGAGRRSPDPGERMAKGRAAQLRPLAWSAPAPGAGNVHAAAEGETAMSGAAEDGAARATPTKHGAANTEAANIEAAKTEAAKTEAAKTEAAKTEAAKTEAAKSGTAEDGPAKLGTAKLETTKHEAAKHEAAKHEDRAARDEAARTETATSEEDTSSEAAPEVMHVYQTEPQQITLLPGNGRAEEALDPGAVPGGDGPGDSSEGGGGPGRPPGLRHQGGHPPPDHQDRDRGEQLKS